MVVSKSCRGGKPKGLSKDRDLLSRSFRFAFGGSSRRLDTCLILRAAASASSLNLLVEVEMDRTGWKAPILMSIRRVSSAPKVSSSKSSRRRSFLSDLLLLALRAATVGMTPEDAAEERVEEEEEEEEAIFLLVELDATRASLSDALRRVDLRDWVGMLLQVNTSGDDGDGGDVAVNDGSVARSICIDRFIGGKP